MVVVIMVLMNMLYYYTQLFNIVDGWSEVRKLYCYPAMYLISADSAICMFKLPYWLFFFLFGQTQSVSF